MGVPSNSKCHEPVSYASIHILYRAIVHPQGIIQNPKREHTLNGQASIAVVRPVRKATLDALSKAWRTLVKQDTAPTLPGIDPGDTGEGDGVHLGMTHNDILQRLHQASEAANKGEYISEMKAEGLALSSNEIRVRGTSLGST
eukprot:gb/GECG01009212.1/.p1 GENE.gb/GECG01009212.1/~~gb/GECG01009212.1/.p1  ORF type:complete len:143 (+),score=10.38 gb/GECG01009212.1/:1-429(+)